MKKPIIKKPIIRLGSFVMCLLVVLQLFSGCTSGKKGQDQKDPIQASAQGTQSGFGPLYPIQGNVTLKIWCTWSATAKKYLQSLAENEAVARAAEDTGVKLEFIHPTGGAQESFNLMIASGEVADIMVKNLYKGKDIGGVEDGLFADLTDLIPKYAPDYYAILQKDAEFRREVTTSDGKIYQMAVYKDATANASAKVEGEWHRVQFRDDWLKEFGMSEPKTFDQYEQYFKNVLAKKPGVVPFCMPGDGQDYILEQPFDVMPGFYLKDRKVVWDKIQPGFRDYLELMNKWYMFGYISKDFINAKPNDLFNAGKAASILGTSIQVYQNCKELNIPVTTGPYVRKTEGQKLHAAYTLWPKNDDGSVFYAKSKYLKEAIAYTNYGYNSEGYKTYQYGPKGISWIPGPDGKPQYTDYMLNNPKYPIADVGATIRMHGTIGGRMRDADRYAMPENIKDPTTLDYRLKWADDPDADAAFCLPPFDITPADNTRRAEIMSDVNTYANEMTLKFIVGAEPIANFDKFVSTLKSMKIDEAIAITQKAYDAHMSKK